MPGDKRFGEDDEATNTRQGPRVTKRPLPRRRRPRIIPDKVTSSGARERDLGGYTYEWEAGGIVDAYMIGHQAG